MLRKSALSYKSSRWLTGSVQLSSQHGGTNTRLRPLLLLCGPNHTGLHSYKAREADQIKDFATQTYAVYHIERTHGSARVSEDFDFLKGKAKGTNDLKYSGVIR